MHNVYMSNTQTVTTQSTQTIKITKAYFEYPTGDADAPDRERVEGTYNVLVDGVDVGQVARDEWVTATGERGRLDVTALRSAGRLWPTS